MITKLFLKLSVILSLFINLLSGQSSILLVDSYNKKIIQLSGTDGSVINPNFIDLSPHDPVHLKGIVYVNNKIWISGEGTMGDIYIYNSDGTYSSTITTSPFLNNIRGMNIVNNEVWVAVTNSNGAVPNLIRRFDFAGNYLGSNPTSLNPYDVIDGINNVAFIGCFFNNGIQKMAYDGTVMGNLVAPGIFNGIIQMNKTSNGNLLVSVVNNNITLAIPAGVYLVSSTSGNILNYYNIIAQGLVQSDNGNIIYTSGGNLYRFDTVTGISSLILSGANFQYLTKFKGYLNVNEAKIFEASVYPNPTQGKIYIKSKSALDNVKVYSAPGQLLKTFNLSKNEEVIDIKEFSTGSYILSLEDKNGKTKSIKILKE